MKNAISICGYKGSGKTWLILRILEHLKNQGYRIAVLKSSHIEEVLTDKQDSDTWKYREAGVEGVLLFQKSLFTLYLSPENTDLLYILEGILWNFDLILCEGLKGFDLISKLWILKDPNELKEILPKLKNLLGIIVKEKNEIEKLKDSYPWLEFFYIEDVEEIAKFITNRIMEKDEVKLLVNRKKIGLKPFIKEFLKVPFIDMVKLLKNVPQEIKEIEFKIKIK